MTRRLSLVTLMTMLAVCALGRECAAAPVRDDPPAARLTAGSTAARQADVATIVNALARGTRDPALRLKAAEKLATLSDRQLRVMASLSRRVTAGGDGPADGIARLLITALLILS